MITEQLQLKNIVQTKDGLRLTVNGISPDFILGLNNETDTHRVHKNNLEGVALSRDVLMEFGFKKLSGFRRLMFYNGGLPMFINKAGTIIYACDNGYYGQYPTRILFKFAHEIQNLFQLTTGTQIPVNQILNNK